MEYQIEKATAEDIGFLSTLEQQCFPPHRQFHARAFKRAITSQSQLVYMIRYKHHPAGSAIVHVFERTWRLYSIAIDPLHQNLGLGRILLNFLIEKAKQSNIQRFTLEADADNSNLLSWYQSFGFNITDHLPNYYAEGEDGYKMELILSTAPRKTINLIVTDQKIPWIDQIPNIEVTSAENFISEKRYQKDDFRVFNLCSSYEYQTVGYYVSLLASARELRSIPNVATIEDFLDQTIIESMGTEVTDLARRTFKKVKDKEITLQIIWGKTKNEDYQKLAHSLYKLFSAPFLEFTFVKGKSAWRLIGIRPLAIKEVVVDETFFDDAIAYFNQKRFLTGSFKNYKYDLAILVNPEDKSAPSCKASLTKFKVAAERVGFYTEFITKEDYHRINQFDALFIRATTSVNDYTYQFSRLAYSEGLVVIDDPWSILKCANKLYLHESMNLHGIKTPKTIFVTTKTDLDFIINEIGFPVVLKQPDSAASRGVFKVKTKEELATKLGELFEKSAIILAQKYIESSFDWRVGILNNKAIYVCKYMMAKNHWQIYNWTPDQDKFVVGGVETLLVEDAPKEVVDAALEAASVIGDGFYGVDLKEANGKIYLIEINDNPSVDEGWEDGILGNELYLIIMRYFFEKIEEARSYKKRSAMPRLG